MSIKFKQLEVLVWVGDVGSFSKAAARFDR